MNILEIQSLTKRFFGVEALNKVNIRVNEGEILALIGPNGSGKTTLFNCVTGFLHGDEGQIFFRGQDLTDYPPHKIAHMGIARTFQLVRIFPNLTVLENLLLAVQDHQERSYWGRLFRTPTVQKYEQVARERAIELLEFVDLVKFIDTPALNLSYGQRKLLTFILSLMSNPDLILLDEPAAAVNLTMINHIKEYIKALNNQGKTIFLIEHNMDVVMDLAQRIVVLDYGHVIAEGNPTEIKNNERVIEAYFGR